MIVFWIVLMLVLAVVNFVFFLFVSHLFISLIAGILCLFSAGLNARNL